MDFEDWRTPCGGYVVREFRCCGMVWQLIVRPAWPAIEGFRSKRCPTCGSLRVVREEEGPSYGEDFGW